MRPAEVTNPADLMLRVTRTDAGLRFTSPQLTGWAVVARGAVPVAQAVDTAMRELQAATYARRRGEHHDLAAWDAAATMLAAMDAELRPSDVIVVRTGRRVAPSVRRQHTDRHDPWSWSDNGDGTWLSPSGNVYRAETAQVQRVVAQRAASGGPQLPLSEVG